MKAATGQIQKGVRWMALAAALLASGLFAACGGGGGGGDGGGVTTTSGISVGQMTKGSIIVNGVWFNTDKATFVIENDNFPAGDKLRTGMIVEVTGTFNDDGTTGTAELVRFADNLEGPVSGLTPSTAGAIQVKSFNVLGQPVRAEKDVTQFDNAAGAVTFDTLANAQVVEISGLPDANGVLQATFIQSKPAGGLLEVKGTVDAITSPTSFTINGLTVTHSGITIAGILAANVLVEVKGTQFDPATTTLIATSVEVNPDDLPDAAKVEVEGFISAFSSNPKTFMINSQLVDYSNAQFLGGVEADLATGLKVEAEGPIGNGILTAVKIKFKESLRFEANVTTVDLNTGTLVLQGFPNLVVQTDAALTPNLALGSFVNTSVKLRGRLSGTTVLVTRLEQVNATDRTSVQGPVSAFSAAGNTVTLFDQVVVNTATINDTDPSGSNFEIEDVKVSKTIFFNNLNVGDLVKARAAINGGNLTWNQIEIELDD